MFGKINLTESTRTSVRIRMLNGRGVIIFKSRDLNRDIYIGKESFIDEIQDN